MRYCHPDYLVALVERHTIVTRAEVLRNGLVEAELVVLDGTADVSSAAEMRRRASVTIADADGTLTPRQASDLLAPFGTELRLWRGIANPYGTSEVGWVHPVATVSISSPKVNDSGDSLTISLDGFDRSRRIRRNPWRSPFPIASQNYASAIEVAVRDRLPTVEFRAEVMMEYASPPWVLGLERNTDPWAEITALAAAAGCEIFFDAMGVCVLRAVVDVSEADVVATYAEGAARNLLAVERDIDDSDTYSRVHVTSENSASDTLYWGQAWDNDPTSPTYVGGSFGDVTLSLTSKDVASVAQAIDFARAELRKRRGASEILRMSLVPNAAHDEGDVIRVDRDRAGVGDVFVLDAFSVPFSVDGIMSATTATRRILTTAASA